MTRTRRRQQGPPPPSATRDNRTAELSAWNDAVGRCHQYVLVFAKGSARAAADRIPVEGMRDFYEEKEKTA